MNIRGTWAAAGEWFLTRRPQTRRLAQAEALLTRGRPDSALSLLVEVSQEIPRLWPRERASLTRICVACAADAGNRGSRADAAMILAKLLRDSQRRRSTQYVTPIIGALACTGVLNRGIMEIATGALVVGCVATAWHAGRALLVTTPETEQLLEALVALQAPEYLDTVCDQLPLDTRDAAWDAIGRLAVFAQEGDILLSPLSQRRIARRVRGEADLRQLELLGKVADGKALPRLQRLAAGARTAGLRLAAEDAILRIRGRVEQARLSAALLQPASAPQPHGDQLLRPAAGPPEVDEQQLLRPGEGPKE